MTARLAGQSARTTSGPIAMRNLRAQIEGHVVPALPDRPTVADQTALIESLCLRGHILGSVTDNERAAEVASELVRDHPGSAQALLMRARTRSAFHRFTDAWGDLAAAARLQPDSAAVAGERAAIHQAVGRYDEALAIRRAAAENRPGFRELAALASIQAERGEVDEAERLLQECRASYRGVSPFPLAMVDLEHGHLRLAQGELASARARFAAALARLPGYAPAAGHLAEVEAALGDPGAAVDRLLPLASASQDPDYAAQLARILGDLGRAEEAAIWCERAALRYDDLLARHAEAFADHAAGFWLGAGADPGRALPLARLNAQVRCTPRARALLARAERAVGAGSG